MATAAPSKPIRPTDIEAKLREIRGGVKQDVSITSQVGIAVGAVTLVAVVGLAFLLGRRRGKQRSTVVEIRRI